MSEKPPSPAPDAADGPAGSASAPPTAADAAGADAARGAAPRSARFTLNKGALTAVLAPVLACVVTLGALTAWTASGAAGSPAEPTLVDARVMLPSNPEATVALFNLTNEGGADDQLVRVSSPTRAGRVMLSENVHENGVGTMRMVSAVRLPAGGKLEMSATGLDVMVEDPPPMRLGERVPFVLHFRDSDPLRVNALVVRPGS
ncbi:copper chaperone PCu(A)C [Streptomyces sp. NPDC057702]|uniref:copper chaperone PCu(A)C n=1 Tax=unclassified Streptomyces TaxID=2593676 RepID=UPI00369E35A6